MGPARPPRPRGRVTTIRGLRVWLGAIGVAACTLDTGGQGSSAANTLGPGRGDTSTTSPTGPAGSGQDTTQGSSTSSGSDPSGSGTDPVATATGDEAQLSLSGAPVVDLGDTAPQMLLTAVLTVTNLGGAEATGVVGAPLTEPFGYTGGAYPGAGGTCQETLAAGQSCTLDVSFVPQQFGLHFDTLSITYDQGAALTRDLVGGGTGQSENLLLNPGGEDPGAPPPSWVNEGPGQWQAGVVSGGFVVHEGTGCLYAGEGPFAQHYALVQDIDVSAWAATIDHGAMRFEFSAWGRTEALFDDEYRVLLRYRAGDDAQIDAWVSDEHHEPFWRMHGTQAAAPSGTRSIRVELGCIKLFGSECKAYFDALDLRAVYP